MIIRETYLDKIRPFYESDLVKIITDIRRCEKSVILTQIMSEIGKITDNIIYLNFEKTSDFMKTSNSLELVDYINNNWREIGFYACKNGKEYYIQVAYSIVDDKAYNREFNAFQNIDNLSKKIIITIDEIDYSTSIVRHIFFNDFL